MQPQANAIKVVASTHKHLKIHWILKTGPLVASMHIGVCAACAGRDRRGKSPAQANAEGRAGCTGSHAAAGGHE